jgi:hypothetical protein
MANYRYEQIYVGEISDNNFPDPFNVRIEGEIGTKVYIHQIDVFLFQGTWTAPIAYMEFSANKIDFGSVSYTILPEVSLTFGTLINLYKGKASGLVLTENDALNISIGASDADRAGQRASLIIYGAKEDI